MAAAAAAAAVLVWFTAHTPQLRKALVVLPRVFPAARLAATAESWKKRHANQNSGLTLPGKPNF